METLPYFLNDCMGYKYSILLSTVAEPKTYVIRYANAETSWLKRVKYTIMNLWNA